MPFAKISRWSVVLTGFAQNVAHLVQQIVYVPSFGASRGATRLRSSVAPRLRIDLLRQAVLTTLLGQCVVTAWSFAADAWPEFRGPTAQGHAEVTGLPTEWSATKNVVWKSPVPGKGWSSPSVVNDRIFLTTAVDAPDGSRDYSLRAICLDVKNGKEIWNVEIFQQAAGEDARIHSKNSHASPTPLISGDRVFVHFGHQGTACLDIHGKILWRTQELKYKPVHGNGGTPALVGDLLIFSCDGGENPFVAALDVASGKVRWKTARVPGDYSKKFAFSTPLLINVDGQPQLVSPGAGSVNAYNPSTGKEIWRVRYDGYSVIPRPVFGHGLVFVSTSYDAPTVLAIRPNGQGDITDSHVAWTSKRGAPHTPSMLLVGDELYMVSDKGIATCVDAKTGKEHWQERIGGNFSSSLLFADGKIFLQSEEGIGTVLKPGKVFVRLADNDLAERTLASYAVVGQSLLIRSEKHLFRIAKPGVPAVASRP